MQRLTPPVAALKPLTFFHRCLCRASVRLNVLFESLCSEWGCEQPTDVSMSRLVYPLFFCVFSHSAPTIKASHPVAPLNYTLGLLKRNPQIQFLRLARSTRLPARGFQRRWRGLQWSAQTRCTFQLQQVGEKQIVGSSLHGAPEFLPLLPRRDLRN